MRYNGPSASDFELMLKPLEKMPFSNIILMDVLKTRACSTVREICKWLDWDFDNKLKDDIGYLVTAGGWSSIDLPSISGREIHRITETKCFPEDINMGSQNYIINRDIESKTRFLVRIENGKIIVERPKEIYMGRPFQEYFTKEKGILGMWFINYEKLKKFTHLPVITIENCRDFAMTFYYSSDKYERRLEAELDKTKKLAVIAKEHGAPFLVRFDLHDFITKHFVPKLSSWLGRNGRLVTEIKNRFPEVYYLKNEKREGIDPSTSSEKGPVIYAIYPGTSLSNVSPKDTLQPKHHRDDNIRAFKLDSLCDPAERPLFPPINL
jgi:hypothetical protein